MDEPQIDREKEIKALVFAFRRCRQPLMPDQIAGMYLDRCLNDPKTALYELRKNMKRAHGPVYYQMGYAEQMLVALIDGRPLPHVVVAPPAAVKIG